MSTMLLLFRLRSPKLYCLMSAALVLINSIQGIQSTCPESTDYPRDGTTCRLRLIHILGGKITDHVIAQGICGDCKGYLVEPTTQELDDLVKQTLAGYNKNAETSGKEIISGVWMGAKRIKGSETFRWKNANFDISYRKYRNFGQGEPRGGTSETADHCLYWKPTGWHSVSCSLNTRHILCQTIGCGVPITMELTRGGTILKNNEIVHPDSQNQDIKLTCKVNGKSPINVQWFREKVKVENAITNQSSLPMGMTIVWKTITATNSDHGKELRCEAYYESASNAVYRRVYINNQQILYHDCSEPLRIHNPYSWKNLDSTTELTWRYAKNSNMHITETVELLKIGPGASVWYPIDKRAKVFDTWGIELSDVKESDGGEYRPYLNRETGSPEFRAFNVVPLNCGKDDDSNTVSGNSDLGSSSPITWGSDKQGTGNSAHGSTSPGNPTHDSVSPGNPAHDSVSPGNLAQDSVSPGNPTHDSVSPGNPVHRSTSSGNRVQGSVDPGNSAYRPTSGIAVKTTTSDKGPPAAEKITKNYEGMSAATLATLIISGIAALLIGFGIAFVITRKREQRKQGRDVESVDQENEQSEDDDETRVDKQSEKLEGKYKSGLDDGNVEDGIHHEINDDIDDDYDEDDDEDHEEEY